MSNKLKPAQRAGWLGLTLAGLLALVSCTRLGALPEGEYAQKIQASPHYQDGEFKNLEETPNLAGDKSTLAAWWEFLTASYPRVKPAVPIPTVAVDFATLPDEDLAVWLGHSSVYLQLAGRKILLDPVVDDYAAPISLFNRAFAGTTFLSPEDFPPLDYVLISHDHWDHLEYPTIAALKDKTRYFICPLGIRPHLERWGVRPEQIIEGDWGDSAAPDEGITINIVPARHFSGRLLTPNQSLWAGYVISTPTRRVFCSGDSGYGRHFAEIGAKFAGIDLALIENGQYNKEWPYIHMFPEQSAQAAADLKARRVLPLHSGRFALSTHAWDDPYIRLAAASAEQDYKLLTPKIGEVVLLDAEQTFTPWWEEVRAAEEALEAQK